MANPADEKLDKDLSVDAVPGHGVEDITVSALPKDTVDPVYAAKAHVLNNAIQAIGMGRYQWQLFVVVGFGWASDNLWPVVTSLILTPVTNEFSPPRPPMLTLAQNIGLLFGAIFWGFGCDIFGRRWAFNLTIGITSVFGLIAAGSPNFAAVAVFAALVSEVLASSTSINPRNLTSNYASITYQKYNFLRQINLIVGFFLRE